MRASSSSQTQNPSLARGGLLWSQSTVGLKAGAGAGLEVGKESKDWPDPGNKCANAFI